MCSFVHIITLFFRLACALSLVPSSLKLQYLEREVEAEVNVKAEEQEKEDEAKVE